MRSASILTVTLNCLEFRLNWLHASYLLALFPPLAALWLKRPKPFIWCFSLPFEKSLHHEKMLFVEGKCSVYLLPGIMLCRFWMWHNSWHFLIYNSNAFFLVTSSAAKLDIIWEKCLKIKILLWFMTYLYIVFEIYKIRKIRQLRKSHFWK